MSALVIRPYTFLSAQYANPNHGNAIAITAESGAVLLSEADTPELWAAMLAAVDPAAFEAPVATEVARHQALLALLDSGITRAMIEAAIAAIADPVDLEITDIRYQQPRWRRDSEFIAWGRATFGLSDAQVLDLFALAATK